MGELKKKRTKDTKEHSLTSFEINFLKELAVERNTAYNNYQRLIQTFLSYISGTRLGYKENQVLDFEFDPNNGNLKVTIKEEK